ncbi:class I SAM-dependent methyltransferase [Collinsella intestinalis]|uniref:class I SAM-dependent methyltransferase n=1 Tax=Collinsella intestinalis TaxID=147207 RepID=UPI0019596AD7|nr:class I SAM-dependent methyltransferase [Collinsella intestinalis]MBM6942744.1 class I SAM-dependent methyltransferase [Collinsella intestinalis]
MDQAVARKLIALNNRFYRSHAASFSATRSTPWTGWEKVARLVEAARGKTGGAAAFPTSLHVLDVACGNMRLARFLAQALPQERIVYHGIDRCAPLAQTAETPNATDRLSIAFHEADILERLLAPGTRTLSPTGRELPAGELVACFGFMHHVPGEALRAALLRELVAQAAPGGIVAVSFWRFMDDARLAGKVAVSDHGAVAAPPWEGYDPVDLEVGDHFLGWQDEGGALRFCHQTDEAELDRLVASVPTRHAEECARFSADGRSGELNRYLVLRKR